MSKLYKTYSQTQPEETREWFLVDASKMPLGRLSVVIADKLMGKSKVTYTPHTDNGDFVVVINARDLVVTGNKMTDKHYYRHSGFPGGLTDLTLEEVIEKDPSQAIKHAVAGMIPKNKLAPERMKRLKIFPGAEHAHTAQTPTPLVVASEAKQSKKETK
ncbi:50S ribosomal protein L13 [Christensenellaceae bacterium OttesenSCG-928-L17]|nr:50S ribosomal protein L13 [Christensenellaceae bacterium OttesenSCG-928-L17]